MRLLETDIRIDAAPQTVWSILDDIDRYPEWNETVPQIEGRTTVDGTLRILLVQPETPDLPLEPTILRIVGARELRWISYTPDPTLLSGEHIFILEPTDDGGCHLRHNEIFRGSLVDTMWPGISINGKAAYERMNRALKARAEAARDVPVAIHPSVDRGVVPHRPAVDGSTLRCLCPTDRVEVRIAAAVSHNHLCGCSKCWKPAGSLFAQTAVVPKDALEIAARADKLQVVDAAQAIRRHACTGCGAHLFGRVDDPDHHFYGVDFVHPELADDPPPAPRFAAFVSSIVETGTPASHMQSVRTRLRTLGLEPYDVFSPELMDVIAYHKVKMARSTERTGAA